MKLSSEGRKKAAKVLGQLERDLKSAVEKCGGPGSGVPGPCPSAGNKPKPAPLAHSAEVKPFKGKPANPNGKDTLEQYRKSDGSSTKERQKLHDEIVAHVIQGSGATGVVKPIAYMMGGGPASGKSVAQKSGMMNMPKNMVTIDSDEIKGMIPEYKQKLAAKYSSAAAFVHEESSYLAKRVLKEATDRHMNTLLDGTGDSSIENLRGKVEQAKKSGRRLEANYVTVDTATAIDRNIQRAKKTGRLPPEAMVRACHKEVSKIVPQAIKEGLFDSLQVFDTNTVGKAIKIASAQGTKLTIHDQGLWDRFLAKANE